jgi:hypothetical protein
MALPARTSYPNQGCSAGEVSLLLPALMVLLAVLGSWAVVHPATWTAQLAQRGENRTTAPPVALTDVVAYKEGSGGYIVHFVLMDASATGTVTLTLTSDGKAAPEGYGDILTLRHPIDAKHFTTSTVGTGAAATSRMTYWFERIPAAALKKPIPSDGAMVRVEFASPDRTSILQGETWLSRY